VGCDLDLYTHNLAAKTKSKIFSAKSFARPIVKAPPKTKKMRHMQILTLLYVVQPASTSQSFQDVECDVVVVGGSAAGLSAAVTSAKEGQTTCLLEPTDMIGGQMTANGIPALDFSHENGRDPFNTTGAPPDTMMANHAHDLTVLLRSLAPEPDYHRTCWVSQYCYLPTVLEQGGIRELIDSAGSKLKVFRQTVLINATTAASNSGEQSIRIKSVQAVQRVPTANAKCGGYATRLSESMPDWYSPAPSAEFDKTLLRFTSSIFVDTSYNGELLVLSRAPFLQGIDERFDGDTAGGTTAGIGNDTVGQSFTMTYQIHLHADKVDQHDGDYPPMDAGWKPNPFRASPAIHTKTQRLNWTNLWTRRRSYTTLIPNASVDMSPPHKPRVFSKLGKQLGMDPPPDSWSTASVGDVHLAAWPDYYYGYIFTPKATTAASITNGHWVGGYDVKNIESAERYSYGAYRAYRDAAPLAWRNKTSLNSSYMGTCTGLAKMPYIRDGRRSVGVDNFLIDINYTAHHKSDSDCIALMGHGFDIWGHRMMLDPIDNGSADCAEGDTLCEAYPAYMRKGGSTGLMCAPMRALTNKKVANLIVGGFTMAQSFMVNSALRMHPQEFQVGVAVGVIAAYMTAANISSTKDALAPAVVTLIQQRIKRYAPLEWAHGPSPSPHPWPKAVGFVCAAPLARCVEVPSGGAFNQTNTQRNCSSSNTIAVEEACPALAPDEWLAIASQVSYDSATKTVTFGESSHIKKSTINSSLLRPADVVAVTKGQVARLRAAVSAPFKVDKYTYVLLRCEQAHCIPTGAARQDIWERGGAQTPR
jgi:hypothetical protein